MALIEMLRNCSELVQYLEAGEPTNSLQSAADETDEIPLNTSTACHETQQSILTKYSFATEGIGLFTVAVVGVFANLLSIAVLAERTMKSQITALLITLAVFDTLFLFCCIPVFAISSVRGFVDYLNTCVYKDGPQIEFMSADMEDYYTYCLPFVYAMTHVAKVGGCFTTLAVSLERYFAVCKPLWIHIRRCHPANYIVSVVVFAVAFNVPKFLEFEIHTLENNRTGIAPSNLRTSEYYVVYYNFVFKTLFTELFPYCSLIYLNVSIYREIRKSVKLQQSMRCTHSQKEEIKSANVVVGVVLLSILCHIWKIVPDLYEAIINLNQQHSSGNTAVTSIPFNSTETQEGMHLSSVNISDIDPYLSVSSTYGPSYLEDSSETLANILISEGRYLNMGNCSNTLKSLGEHYNITVAGLAKFLNSYEVEGETEDIAEELPSYNIEFIIDTSHLLVGINSAANFFLYLILRKNFRAATWRILSCKRQVIRSPRTQYSIYNHNSSGQHNHRVAQGNHSANSKSDHSRHANRKASHAAFTEDKHGFNTENSNQVGASNLNMQKTRAMKMHSLDQMENHKKNYTPNNFKERNDACTTTTPIEDLTSTYPSKIRENGTLGVRFKDKHQTCHKSISTPVLNHTSMIESSHSNNSQTNMDDNIFQGQKVIDSKPEKKENEKTFPYKSTICLSSYNGKDNSLVHRNNESRDDKDLVREENVQCIEHNSGLFLGNGSPDTSSSVTSSCLNPCSASAISSTLTVISANKIFEDRSTPDFTPIHSEQQTFKGEHVGRVEETSSSLNKKRNKRRHKPKSSTNSKKVDEGLELKPLLSHQLTKVRIRSYSEDIPFPTLVHANNRTTCDGSPTNERRNHDLTNFQGPLTIKTVIINL